LDTLNTPVHRGGGGITEKVIDRDLALLFLWKVEEGEADLAADGSSNEYALQPSLQSAAHLLATVQSIPSIRGNIYIHNV